MLFKKQNKGVLLIELLIACLIIVTAIITLIGTFSLFAVLTAKSRHRVYAEQMTKSAIERIRAHNFGDPEPYNWQGEFQVKIIPDIPISKLPSAGQSKKVIPEIFTQKITYENGSFIGQGNKDYDVITITINWKEARPGHHWEKEGGYSQVTAVMEARKPVPFQSIKH